MFAFRCDKNQTMKSNLKYSLLFVFLLSLSLVGCEEEEPAPIMQKTPDMMDDDPMNGGNGGGMGNNPDDPGDTLVVVEGNAPNFTLQSVDGQEVTRMDFIGKPLVIFFFGSTCPNCIASAPTVQSHINEVYTNGEISIIGIDTWDGNSNAVNNFRNSTGVTFDLLLNGSDVEDDYDITYDRLVVIDADGDIVFKGSTRASSDVSNVISTLDGLL